MLSDNLKALLGTAEVFDLGQSIYPGMPHHPNQPPFGYVLLKKHGDITLGDNKVSFCNDLFMMGGHTGTHLDAICHVACNNHIFNNVDVSDMQDYKDGVQISNIESTPPIVKKGVLLDIPRYLNLDVLPPDFGIGKRVIEDVCQHQKISIEQNDVVLFRTGWMKYWDDRKKYVSVNDGAPGVVEDGAQFLASQKVSFVGSDTTAFERVPPHDLPCHVILLVENGIQIMEMLYLEDLAAKGKYTFVFIALPLKIRGGTGSPIRPIAIV